MDLYCIHNLEEINDLLEKINEKTYTHPSNWLSGSTIGQHVRHVLEFYICLIHAQQTRVVNYDKRKRDFNLENKPTDAQAAIHEIISHLIQINTLDRLKLEGNFNSESEDLISVETSFVRELAYCLEHSIHHQALIKIALIELDLISLIKSDFGVAPATWRYKNKTLKNKPENHENILAKN